MKVLVFFLVGIFLFFVGLGAAAAGWRPDCYVRDCRYPMPEERRTPVTVPGMEDPDYTGPVSNFKYLPPERFEAVLEARAARAAAARAAAAAATTKKAAEEKVAEEPCPCKEQAATVKQEPPKQAAPKVAAAPVAKKPAVAEAKAKKAAKKGKEGNMDGIIVLAIVSAIAIVAIVAMVGRQHPPCGGYGGHTAAPTTRPPQTNCGGQANTNAPLPTRQQGGAQGS